MGYKETSLWRKSLGNNQDEYKEEREHLIYAFDKAHENAKVVLAKIRKDFPNLTVHDITHVDGLWQVASVIIGDDYEINPLEAFVLGCAFLMHDAVLSYEAAGGKDRLRETLEWKDYYKDCERDERIEADKKLSEADFKTIRLLHAKYAERLYDQLFNKDDGSKFYIIEDSELRCHYGEIIGKIASSHHWDIDQVEKLGTQFSPTSDFPWKWEICPIKLACILRCADAGHIDNGRAPDHLLKLLKVNGVSRDHWSAQNKLSQIEKDRDDPNKAVIMSNNRFKENDFAAWNVAFDAVQVLDRELRLSNDLLKRKHVEEFQIKSVSGANSRETLSHYIKTDGWKPYDADIHISNIENLIHNLGGEKLYGKDNQLEIVLRELIQNSRDAIVARRNYEGEFDGKICIEIIQNDSETWVSVKDNGIGMSIATIKNYFLNFGSSFWMSDLAKQEYPGLNSSEFKSIGQYGIGFYSIFMVASQVIVRTRKYDAGLGSSLQLKFPSGLSLRPIISNVNGISSVTTEVRFLIDRKKCCWNKIYKMKPSILGSEDFDIPYSYVLSNITSGLDVDVYYKELDDAEKKIHKNINCIKSGSLELAQWLKDITYAECRDTSFYSKYIDSNYKRLRKINVEGKFYGVAALNTWWYTQPSFFSVLTVGGLAKFGSNSYEGDFIGFLEGDPVTAQRDVAESIIDRSAWAREQYSIICDQGLTGKDKLYLPYIIGRYGIDMTDIMTVRSMNKSRNIFECNLGELVKCMAENQISFILPLSITNPSLNRIEYYLDYDISSQMLDVKELLFIPEKSTGFLNIDLKDEYFPYNIFRCIEIVSNKMGVIVQRKIDKEKVKSRFDLICDAIVLSFEHKRLDN